MLDLEANPAARTVLDLPDNENHRWRQAVGVGVKLAMTTIGWSTTGIKRTVVGSEFFIRAEFYAPPA